MNTLSEKLNGLSHRVPLALVVQHSTANVVECSDFVREQGQKNACKSINIQGNKISQHICQTYSLEGATWHSSYYNIVACEIQVY